MLQVKLAVIGNIGTVDRGDHKGYRHHRHQKKAEICADQTARRNGSDQQSAKEEFLVTAEQELIVHAQGRMRKKDQHGGENDIPAAVKKTPQTVG